MEITLNSKEINKALISFVTGKFNLDPSQKIHLEYKAGRGENGPTASIIIDEVSSTPNVVKTDELVHKNVEENISDSVKICNKEDQSCYTEDTKSETVNEFSNLNSVEDVEEDEL